MINSEINREKTSVQRGRRLANIQTETSKQQLSDEYGSPTVAWIWNPTKQSWESNQRCVLILSNAQNLLSQFWGGQQA
jgi:hypothetical protein